MYLGSPGRMVGLKCPVAQRDRPEEGYRFVTTLEGKRKAQVAPGLRRVWDVELGNLTTPAQVAALQEFAAGAWGMGPFWFVSADAPLVNLMTPYDSLASGAHPGGPMRLDDGGWAAVSTAAPNNEHIFWRTEGLLSDPPVIPGRPVTASAYVEGVGGYGVLQFFSRDNVFLAQQLTDPSDTPLTGTRLSATAIAPEGAVYARFSVRNASRAARPAVTWTDGPVEWGEGLGCAKTVVHSVGRDLVRAVPGQQVYSNTSFVLTEVG